MMDFANTYRLYSTLPLSLGGNSHAEVDLQALRENYSALAATVRSRANHARVIAVVKADAYGHGAEQCVRTLLREGCDSFAVSCIEEARGVREVCLLEGVHADILIFGYTDPMYVGTLAALSLTQSLFSFEYACALHEAAVQNGVRLSVHIAVDTGMNRVGFGAHSDDELEESADQIQMICGFPNFETRGLFTHFARADETAEEAVRMTDLQSMRYRDLLGRLKMRQVSIPFHHVCNSAAAATRDADLFDGVRLGAHLYGIGGATSVRSLRPVMRFCTRIVHLHPLLAGESVGYGGRFLAKTNRTVAILPVGYADGLSRDCTGANLLLHTQNGDCVAPIIGNICMDQCMVDVTGLLARVGDEVTVFGRAPCTAEVLAESANTIDYEILCALSARVPRVYLNTRDDKR